MITSVFRLAFVVGAMGLWISGGAVALAGNVTPVWAPTSAPASAGAETVQVTIVDFGHDNLREGDGAPASSSGFTVCRFRLRGDGNGATKAFLDYETSHEPEVDGDPQTKDSVGFYRFSLDDPLTPEAPWFDAFGRSSRFYGGGLIEQANSDKAAFHECGVNNAVEGPLLLPRDNWSFFHEHFDFYSPFRVHLVFLWPKRHFLNGGAGGRVAIKSDSVFHLYLQRYFMGVDGVRVVVKDADKYWISEHQFRGAAGYRGMLHHLRAGDTRWAPYAPAAPRQIGFDPTAAAFDAREFSDVQAVGFYASKHKLAPANFGFKFYAFEVDALVTRAKRPSETMRMERVAAEKTPPFWMSATEVPYRLWNRVHKNARDNCFADLRGMTFDRDGDMGSMNFPVSDGKLLNHSPDEPVTGITLHDAAAWLNAVSLLESRVPCYYLDPKFATPFREVIFSPASASPQAHPPLYVKWDADGYRLPTSSEWLAAAGSQRAEVGGPRAESTRPVGSGQPSANGLYDMLGNVWEMVWTYGDCFDPGKNRTMTVFGGDFRFPAPMVASNPWGDRPAQGLWNIGFRALRRETGMARPEMPAGQGQVPSWTFDADEVIQGKTPSEKPKHTLRLIPVPEIGIEVATTEVPYALWRHVYTWAVANGYAFDHSGQMGSMSYHGYEPWGPPGSHGPEEPVTGITSYDAWVWCNALSEVEGRKPVTYEDAAMTKPLRSAYRYRPLHMIPGEVNDAMRTGMLSRAVPSGIQQVYHDPQADGYRLPLSAEYRRYAADAAGGRYSWGNSIAEAALYAWLFETSGGTTHPVSTKKPNALGLFDLEGNVSEWGVEAKGRNHYNIGRCGGGFFDLVSGVSTSVSPETHMGCAYPDVGFRVVRQRPGKSQIQTMNPVGEDKP